MPQNVVVVGAGHAGVEMCASLRGLGFQGSLVLLSAESVPPYERPPLSKDYLAGRMPEGRSLRSESFYRDRRIDLLLDSRVASIDRRDRGVVLESGAALPYDVLVLAVGGSPRRCAIPGLENVAAHYLHDIDQAGRLARALRAGGRLLVCGGGFIGLEVAATAVQCGVEVVLVERQDRLLERVAPAAVSQHFLALHRSRGVHVKLGCAVREFSGPRQALLSDDSRVDFTFALMGIGSTPNVDLARQAGLAASADGISVDSALRTVDPNIYAIGDCALRSTGAGRSTRLESIGNAVHHARIAAAHLCGADPGPEETPWFWSSQYGEHLQIAGTYDPASPCIVKFAEQRRLLAVQHRMGRVHAVFGANMPAEVQAGRRLVASGKGLEVPLLEDQALSLRNLLGRVA